MKREPTLSDLRRRHERANREAAQIISGDPEKYSVVMQEWARAIVAKYEPLLEAREVRN